MRKFLVPSPSSLRFNKLSLSKMLLKSNVISKAAPIRQSLNAIGVENKFAQLMLTEDLVLAIIETLKV